MGHVCLLRPLCLLCIFAYSLISLFGRLFVCLLSCVFAWLLAHLFVWIIGSRYFFLSKTGAHGDVIFHQENIRTTVFFVIFCLFVCSTHWLWGFQTELSWGRAWIFHCLSQWWFLVGIFAVQVLAKLCFHHVCIGLRFVVHSKPRLFETFLCGVHRNMKNFRPDGAWSDEEEGTKRVWAVTSCGFACDSIGTFGCDQLARRSLLHPRELPWHPKELRHPKELLRHQRKLPLHQRERPRHPRQDHQGGG